MARPAKKLFYRIGEVCEICGLEPHVLRYWEGEFSVLNPAKNKSGQRIYRQKDLELVQAIKYLLYEEGYTIAGANRRLREDGHEDLPLFKNARKALNADSLRELKQSLTEVLEILDGKSKPSA